MNIFIRFGNWLARRSLADRVLALENIVSGQSQVIEKMAAVQKEMKSALSKVEMYVGFRRTGQAKEDIRNVLDTWNGM